MGAIQTQLAKRRQEVIGRSMAFQARLVENVFGAMFSSSKLGVDLADGTSVGRVIRRAATDRAASSDPVPRLLPGAAGLRAEAPPPEVHRVRSRVAGDHRRDEDDSGDFAQATGAVAFGVDTTEFVLG